METMTLERKAAEYAELRRKLDELEAQKKLLAEEILQLMPRDTLAVHIPGYRIKRASMLSIKTSIEDAEKLDAVKMKPIVDRAKIKQLYEAGENPPDVSEIQFLQLYRVAPKEPLLEECPF